MPYPVREIELIPQNIPLDIHYEDDDLVVVNKPANMVVHPGYGNYTGTLVNALVYHFDHLPHRSQDYYGRPGLVHRLDKHTTGLMVIAKTEHALTHLAKQFYDRTTERRYQALVWGDVTEDGIIQGNIGRSLKNRKMMTVFPDGEHGKHAVTHYTVLKRFGLVTLVECKLETGRTHQIRVHLAHFRHPLVGDPLYGSDPKLAAALKLDRQWLHAHKLAFSHPISGEWVEFESDYPQDLELALNRLRDVDFRL